MAPILLAFSLLTTIPVGKIKNINDSTWVRSVCYYPICGYIIAILVLLPVFLLDYFFKIDQHLLAVITVSLLALITGALHLDGFADICDGFFYPAETKKRRLEIMHDSSVGTFGVVGLIMLLLTKFAAISVLLRTGNFFEIGAIIVLTRFFMVLLIGISIHPCEEGLGKFVVGKLPKRSIALSFILIIPCLCSIKLLVIAVVLTFAALLLRSISYRLIEGVTGDVLGACCEICETLGFLVLAAIT